MDNHSNDNHENPLEELAAELAGSFDDKPINAEQASYDRVEGGQVRMRQSSARSVSAHAIQMEESAAALVRADSLDAKDSAMGVVISDNAKLENVTASVVGSRTVHASNIHTFALFAGRIEGNVKTVLTPFTALFAGLGVGIALIIGQAIFSKIFSRKRTKIQS